MSSYKESLQSILEGYYPELRTRYALTFKNCFGAMAGYVDDNIFCSCGKFGFALKLPPAEVAALLKDGAQPLKYFPNGYVKKEYAVIPVSLIAEKKAMKKLIKKSILFSIPLNSQ
jgi:TfoX/Sxy family transcriptional regulator of competence genes